MKTDNELIAEFMGAVYMDVTDHHGNAYKNVPIPPNKIIIEETCCRYSLDFEYHSSWDWLMPVVEKIKQLYNDSEDIFKEEWYTKSIFQMGIMMPIKAVYEAVVEFIKWYNTQNPKP